MKRLLILGLLALGCSSGGPCAGAMPLGGCGRACVGTAGCELGLHCGSDGRCTAECGPGFPCSGSLSCTSDGTCMATMDSGPPDANRPDSGPIDSPPTDNTCALVRVETLRTIPNVILVIDRSGSMNLPFDGTATRWQVLQDSLLRSPDGLISSLAHAVRFGVVMYSEDPEAGSCPDVSTLSATIDNYDGVMSMFTANRPGGNTPTGQTLQLVLDHITDLAPETTAPTVIVLSTDGEPATCEDGTDITTGRMLSVDTATAAYAMGIETYVISVGTEIAATHLQEVANAGAGNMPSDPDAMFWVATDTTGLHDDLVSIVSGVISCEVELQGMIDPALACSGTVTLGSEELQCGTDWHAVDSTHIELIGPACIRFRHSVEVLFGTFPCNVLI